MRHQAVRIAAVMTWALPALVMTAGPASAQSSQHTSLPHASAPHASSPHTSSLQTSSLHTSLKAASPGIGSTVPPPSRIVLTFADPVGFPQVVLTDTAGTRHQSGKAQAVDDTVTEQVAGRLPPGVYTVGWRVVATDGHPVSGTYEFSVAGAAGPAAASGTGGGASRTTAAGEASSGTGWWWAGLAVLLVAGGAAGVVLTRRSLRRDDLPDES